MTFSQVFITQQTSQPQTPTKRLPTNFELGVLLLLFKMIYLLSTNSYIITIKTIVVIKWKCRTYKQ
uniref:Uncharacterized protein n=1 Tax=Rhizophora mucronata TaxID=61149 RepID=A0A2P2N3E2_RHIMU